MSYQDTVNTDQIERFISTRPTQVVFAAKLYSEFKEFMEKEEAHFYPSQTLFFMLLSSKFNERIKKLNRTKHGFQYFIT